MATEQWYVSGYELTGFDADVRVREVEYRTGLYVSPVAEGENPPIPGMTGRLWRPKKHGQGRFNLSMWLDGGNTTREATEVAYDELLRALFRPHELLRFRRVLAGGTARECWGEVISDLAPTPVGQLAMRYTVEVGVPAGYWEADMDETDASTTGADLPQTLVLSTFAAATAPMETLTYRIDGPVAAPQIVDVTDEVDGFSFSYSGTIPDGQRMIIDAEAWTITGGGGFTPNLAAVSYTDTGRYMTVVAGKPGASPSVQLRGTNGGANTRLTVTGRPRFLV